MFLKVSSLFHFLQPIGFFGKIEISKKEVKGVSITEETIWAVCNTDQSSIVILDKANNSSNFHGDSHEAKNMPLLSSHKVIKQIHSQPFLSILKTPNTVWILSNEAIQIRDINVGSVGNCFNLQNFQVLRELNKKGDCLTMVGKEIWISHGKDICSYDLEGSESVPILSLEHRISKIIVTREATVWIGFEQGSINICDRSHVCFFLKL